ALKRTTDPIIEFRFGQPLVKTDTEGNIFVDRHREWRWLLEHHPDFRAQQVKILGRRKNVIVVEPNMAGRALVRVEVVHPVEDTQQRRLSAAGGADKRGHLSLVERNIDALQRAVISVKEIEIADRYLLGEIPVACRRMGYGGTVIAATLMTIFPVPRGPARRCSMPEPPA